MFENTLELTLLDIYPLIAWGIVLMVIVIWINGI